MTPDDVDVRDAASFTYGDSMQRGVQNDRGVLFGDSCFLYLSGEKDDADDNMSWDTVTVEMMQKGTKIVLWINGWTTC